MVEKETFDKLMEQATQIVDDFFEVSPKNTEKKIEFGELKMDGDIPVLEVKVIQNNDILTTGYLSPFRGYCFQVSGTFHGMHDMGSGMVIGLGHCINVDDQDGWQYRSNTSLKGIEIELLRGQALIALADFAYMQKAILPRTKSTWGHECALDEFLVKTAEWIR